jgi:hypothetical protein
MPVSTPPPGTEAMARRTMRHQRAPSGEGPHLLHAQHAHPPKEQVRRNDFHNFHLWIWRDCSSEYVRSEIEYQNAPVATPVKSSVCGKICGTFAPFGN